MTDCFLPAMIALCVSRHRKDIMGSGLCPPEGFVSHVIWAAREYCRTTSGMVAVAMCATTRANRSLSLAWVPKAYQCSARMPRGSGALRRGMRFKVIGMNFMTSAVKMCETWALDGTVSTG